MATKKKRMTRNSGREEMEFATIPYLDASSGRQVITDARRASGEVSSASQTTTSSSEMDVEEDPDGPLDRFEAWLVEREVALSSAVVAFDAHIQQLALRENWDLQLDTDSWRALFERSSAVELRERQQPRALIERALSLDRCLLEPRLLEATLAYVDQWRLLSMSLRKCLQLCSMQADDYCVSVVRDSQLGRIVAFTVIRRSALYVA